MKQTLTTKGENAGKPYARPMWPTVTDSTRGGTDKAGETVAKAASAWKDGRWMNRSVDPE